jgi:hypothetical protein
MYIWEAEGSANNVNDELQCVKLQCKVYLKNENNGIQPAYFMWIWTFYTQTQIYGPNSVWQPGFWGLVRSYLRTLFQVNWLFRVPHGERFCTESWNITKLPILFSVLFSYSPYQLSFFTLLSCSNFSSLLAFLCLRVYSLFLCLFLYHFVLFHHIF